MDFIKQLGEAAFGTRLRMLTERFFQDGAKLYESQNVDFEPRWFTIFYLLSTRSPLTITEITSELSYTQPAVTQIANVLIKKGLVKVVKDKSDTRKKLLALSPKGLDLLDELKPVWQGFEDAVKELFTEIGYDLIYIISKTENALDKRDMFERVSEKIKEKQLGKVELVKYAPEYRDKFRELNYEWLEKYFTVEPEDKKLLGDPEGEIIKKGGEVVFAKLNDEIVGTAALIKFSDGEFELAKMAVTEKVQGRQIGKKLAEEIIRLAKAKKAHTLFLETNVKLNAALKLYKKFGFELVENTNSKYARSTIKMELKLN
ncbi:MAG: ribosomal-protein-alanine N-acetyltransferase [Chlorobi bacterium OLB5]|nr:MAG: ribosomal-protein-alanine N-acetyltransferase [Chlorobi bacterium OLB5]